MQVEHERIVDRCLLKDVILLSGRIRAGRRQSIDVEEQPIDLIACSRSKNPYFLYVALVLSDVVFTAS
jgi:hypothetical protein